MKAHVVITGTGWILEEMAGRLAHALPYVSYGTAVDPSADIQYYVTYAGLRNRVSPIEIGWFTHMEPTEPLKSMFLTYGRRFDYCVTQCEKYFEILSAQGANNLSIISPGVDLERFRPKLRVGVVGRTYETGRKGEETIAQLMDLDFVEWKFTGAGWPGESVFIPDIDLPDFYRSLDVILIASAYEGGPLCAIEALACGVPVVSTPVGWMQELPHIPFEYGNVEQLKGILATLFAEKNSLRQAVLDRSWKAYIEKHDKLFRAAYEKHLTTQQGVEFNKSNRNWSAEICKEMMGDVLCVQAPQKIVEKKDFFQNVSSLAFCSFDPKESIKLNSIPSLEKLEKSSFDVIYVEVSDETVELGSYALKHYNDLLRSDGLLIGTLKIADGLKKLDEEKSQKISEAICGVEKVFKLLALEDLESVEQNSFSSWSFVAQKVMS